MLESAWYIRCCSAVEGTPDEVIPSPLPDPRLAQRKTPHVPGASL